MDLLFPKDIVNIIKEYRNETLVTDYHIFSILRRRRHILQVRNFDGSVHNNIDLREYKCYCYKAGKELRRQYQLLFAADKYVIIRFGYSRKHECCHFLKYETEFCSVNKFSTCSDLCYGINGIELNITSEFWHRGIT